MDLVTCDQKLRQPSSSSSRDHWFESHCISQVKSNAKYGTLKDPQRNFCTCSLSLSSPFGQAAPPQPPPPATAATVVAEAAFFAHVSSGWKAAFAYWLVWKSDRELFGTLPRKTCPATAVVSFLDFPVLAGFVKSYYYKVLLTSSSVLCPAKRLCRVE